MNPYCPLAFPPDFTSRAFAVFMRRASGDSFVGGDFSFHLNPSFDKHPHDIFPPSKEAMVLNNIFLGIEYSDVWRKPHPTDSEFTFYSAPHKIYMRIDSIFLPSLMMFLASSCCIGSIVLSDHAPLYLVYSLAGDRALSPCWRFQPHLPKWTSLSPTLPLNLRSFIL